MRFNADEVSALILVILAIVSGFHHWNGLCIGATVGAALYLLRLFKQQGQPETPSVAVATRAYLDGHELVPYKLEPQQDMTKQAVTPPSEQQQFTRGPV